MRLYHYTCVEHLPKIVEAGMLTTTESNVGRPTDAEFTGLGRQPLQGPGPIGADAAPRVVWLTSAAIADAYRIGLTGSAADKTRVRITVEVDDAQPWVRWAKRHEINRRWLHLLTKGRDPDSWYIVERPVPRGEWREVAVDGRVIDTPTAERP